jgi:hypothetical protein
VSENPDPYPFKQLKSYPAPRNRRPDPQLPKGGLWPFLVTPAVGAVCGFAVSAILNWSATKSQQECANANEICVGAAPVVGFVGGFFLVLALFWAGFALAGLRPLRGYIPFGFVVFVVTTEVFMSARQGGRLHPAAAYAGAMAATFLALPIADVLRRPPRS